MLQMLMVRRNRRELEKSRLQFQLESLANLPVSFLVISCLFFFQVLSASANPSTAPVIPTANIVPTTPVIPAQVSKRLAQLESWRRADQEMIAELSQKITRMESENRSMREWSSDRFMSMWETSNGRDVNIMHALQNMHAILVEENTRQTRIRQTAENLESLLQMPTPSLPPMPAVDPPILPQPPTSPTRSRPSSPFPSGQAEDGEIRDSRKRTRSVVSDSHSKRQKL